MQKKALDLAGNVEVDTDLKEILEKALSLGVSYADARYQSQDSERVMVDNRTLKDYSSDRLSGVGIRTIIGGALGYASTSDTSRDSLEKTLHIAVKGARSVKAQEKALAPVIINQAVVDLSVKADPFDVSPEEKVHLVMEANKTAFVNDQIKNAITMYGATEETRLFISTEGAEVKVKTTLLGVGHISVAQVGGVMESVSYFGSKCAGFEFIESSDWLRFTEDLSKLSIEAAGSKTPKSGTYPVVVDPEVVGVILHEAFGHASEGDLVSKGASVLQGKIGGQIASDQVTVYDEGVIEDGFYYPFDDEGVKKERTTLVEDGILRGYLLDRHSAVRLDGKSTGNGRAQDFQNSPIVRQTNTYLKPRDHDLEELFEDIEYGIYIMPKGLEGGQVNPTTGTFTFGVGPSKLIEHGELTETVRGVVISGSILDTLNTVDAVGKDLKITTNAFGGCGKMGQRAWVGAGGPSVRVQKMTVGGS